MLSNEGLAALRIAATFAHDVPGIRVRVRSGHRCLVDVGPVGTPSASIDAKAVTPCGFRVAVARAFAVHRSGQPLAFLDLPAGVDPSVDIGVPPCGKTFHGGIHRVPLGGRQLYAFGTTLPPERCRDEADRHVTELTKPERMWGIGVRHDPATAVCLIYAELDAGDHPRHEPHVIELLETVMARLAIAQLLDDLAERAQPR